MVTRSSVIRSALALAPVKLNDLPAGSAFVYQTQLVIILHRAGTRFACQRVEENGTAGALTTVFNTQDIFINPVDPFEIAQIEISAEHYIEEIELAEAQAYQEERARGMARSALRRELSRRWHEGSAPWAELVAAGFTTANPSALRPGEPVTYEQNEVEAELSAYQDLVDVDQAYALCRAYDQVIFDLQHSGAKWRTVDPLVARKAELLRSLKS